MINTSLKLISTPKAEFLQHCFESNIERGFKHGLSDQGAFSQAMMNLNSFCSMISHFEFYKSDNVIISLRKAPFKFNTFKYEKIYAIDQTGLSYGFLCGPAEPDEHEVYLNDVTAGSRFKKIIRSTEYYGYDPRSEFKNYTFKYDLAPGYFNTQFGGPGNLTPAFIRDNICPLYPKRKDMFSQEYFDFYKSSNTNDRSMNGDIIVRTNNGSYYLPIIALLKEHMNDQDSKLAFSVGTDLYADPATKVYNGEPTYFGFNASYLWRQGKYNCSRYWKGTISFEKFEVLNMEITQEKEYDD